MTSINLHELLIQSVVDYAIYMLDPEGRVVSWNTGAERIKGYAAGEIIGEHFSRFYTDEERVDGVPAKALRIAAETGRFTASWLRVSGTTERPQIDQCVGHQFHAVMPQLLELKAQQKPLELVLPRKGPLHA